MQSRAPQASPRAMFIEKEGLKVVFRSIKTGIAVEVIGCQWFDADELHNLKGMDVKNPILSATKLNARR
jgi:hypothetical protein